LWGSSNNNNKRKSRRGGSSGFLFNDNDVDSDNDNDLDSTAGTQDENLVVQEASDSTTCSRRGRGRPFTTSGSKPHRRLPPRHRLMRKKAFHS